MNPKISVIIPVYNTKDYLKESIDSIIDQKEYIHELFLINDGSTDGSGDLIEKLYGNLDFVQVFHTENQRQGPARNLGTEKSTGDYIYYFDSDDIIKPGLFKRFFDLVKKEPDLDIFCFSAEPFLDDNYKVDENKKKSILSTTAYNRKMNVICENGEDAFNLLFPIKSFSPLPYLYIFKKVIVVENNIRYRSIRFEDEEFVYQLFLKAKKTIISNEMFVDRRIREGSTMELDRCFADILGYIKTIETLQKLKSYDYLKAETKNNLQKKIIILAYAIIKIKVINNLKLSNKEMEIYKGVLKSLFKLNKGLMKYYYTYPIEYKLRHIKKKLFY